MSSSNVNNDNPAAGAFVYLMCMPLIVAGFILVGLFVIICATWVAVASARQVGARRAFQNLKFTVRDPKNYAAF